MRGTPRSAARSLWRTYRYRDPSAFLLSSIWPWITHYLSVVFSHPHPIRAYVAPATGIYDLPETSLVAAAGDWGTGTRTAYAVGERIAACRPDITIHLGDVYYSGTASEYRDFFLDAWPRGTLRTFVLNANHEMYSGGYGYFGLALPTFGQDASFFCLQNEHWRVVAVDTGYYARILPLLEAILKGLIRPPDENEIWLEDVVFRDPTDRRPVILLSHHPWFSAFDTEYGSVGRSMSPFLDRVLLWLWAHEHRFAGYGRFALDDDRPVFARCIGHGGMPIELSGRPKRKRNLVFYDNRSVGTVGKARIGACGYALLRFRGSTLQVEYQDETGASLLTEEWRTGPSGTAGRVVYSSPDLTWVRPANELVE